MLFRALARDRLTRYKCLLPWVGRFGEDEYAGRATKPDMEAHEKNLDYAMEIYKLYRRRILAFEVESSLLMAPLANRKHKTTATGRLVPVYR